LGKPDQTVPQGIHNIFIVIPQFLVTGFAALLFAIVDPEKPAFPGHRAPVAPHPGPVTNVTLGLSKNITDSVIKASRHMLRSTEVGDASHSNSVVYIFRYVLSFIIHEARVHEHLVFSVSVAWLRPSLLCFVGG
jgi:hypothetical protein